MTTTDTYYVYLDSEQGDEVGDSLHKKYKFPLAPTLKTVSPERGSMYIKDFTIFNDFNNVNYTNDTATITIGSDAPVHLTLTHGHYNTGESLLNHIKEIVKTAAGIEELEWNFNPVTLKGDFSYTESLQFSGKIFTDIFNLEEDKIYAAGLAISNKAVDINKHLHNVYVSVGEITTNSVTVGSARNIPNRICKIPIRSEYGGYVVFQPIIPQRIPVLNTLLSTLTLQLYLDDGVTIESDKFTASVVIEITKPINPNPHAIRDAPNGYYSNGAQQPVLYPNVYRKC